MFGIETPRGVMVDSDPMLANVAGLSSPGRCAVIRAMLVELAMTDQPVLVIVAVMSDCLK